MKHKDANKLFERLLSCIPDGYKNAISQRKLAELMKCEETELRAIVQSARKHGIPILSIPGSTGYYMSNDPGEVIVCYRAFKQRNMSNEDVLRCIRKHLYILGVHNPDKEEGEKDV